MASSSDIFAEYMANPSSGYNAAPTEDQAWAQFQAQNPGGQVWVPGDEGGGLGPGAGGHWQTQAFGRDSQAFKTFKAKLGVKDAIGQGFDPAYGYVRGGSGAAAGLLRQGYEDAFRARAAGYTGAVGQQENDLGVQATTQGLAPDVAARMLSQYKSGGLQTLAGYRADYGSQLGTGLSELSKGTGTELAGLSANEAAVRANYMAAIKGAQMTSHAASTAGALGALGSLGGGVAMATALA
jgi:hypothetical protein